MPISAQGHGEGERGTRVGALSPLVRATLLALFGGACSWLVYPPIGAALAVLFPVGALVAVAAIMTTDHVSRRWPFYAMVWVVGVLKWTALNAWMMQITTVGFPALSCYAALFDLLLVWLLVRGRCATLARVPWAVLTPIVLGGTESLRALVLFDGYPWFRAGHPLAEWPVMIQVADVGGELLVSLVVACAAGAIIDAGSAQGRRALGVITALTALGCTFVYGAYRLGEAPQGTGPGVLAIQTNLHTSNKVRWMPNDQVKDVQSFAQLTLDAAISTTRQGNAIALTAWPETSLGGYGLEPDVLSMMDQLGYFPGSRFQRLMAQLSIQLGTPILVGSPVFQGMRIQGDRWIWDHQFNSAYLIAGAQLPYPRYDKLFLAPFGETMPYIRAWPALQQQLLSLGAQGMEFTLESGAAPVRFQIAWDRPDGTVQPVRVAVPICFEDAMGWVCRELVFEKGVGGRERRADLLVNISNDGWFGWFDGGRAQHQQIAQFRCVETRTPMVRVANTGMCAGIDSSGRITQQPPATQTATWLYANPPLDDRTPLYAHLGEAVSWVVMALSAALGLFSFVRPGPRLGGAVHAGVVVLAALSVFGFGCEEQKKLSQQPWSSREQSVKPQGNARLSEQYAPGVIPVESSGEARQTAGLLLQAATRSPVPVFRANAVEALMLSPDDLRMVAQAMLADPNRGVRFVAAMAVGRTRMAEFAAMVQPLLVDESPSVRAAAIYALTRFGQKIDPTPLAAMARSDDPEVRSNAYMVLGEMGNPTAVPIIRQSLGKGMRRINPARVRLIELQAAEAMVKLGDLNQLEPIRAALFSPTGGPGDQSELTALAAQIAGRLHDEGSRPMLVRLIGAIGESARPAEIRLTAAASLAELGVQDHVQIARLSRAYIRDRDPIVRGQAALALGRSEGRAAVPDLERMLFDSDPSVQLAAAKSVLIATSPH